ncbi:helix-turn-helix domain-containing protein [Liquorilactobacillus nagelii]|jgi:transcriptional regulator with XRE-family HTH domain|uniref:helix-turn-helix domain-containing protein n=1 Tax=Liquorilactobacillus nagelii TaxID=82688 RepID=UPI002431F348|nr:helix-turn-helix transcriptional regulator [Liquorilactobacillus nagelii]MCI1699434.1 helix-turn-helix domain-containing protein [Liquorilactobacillus nagelii]
MIKREPYRMLKAWLVENDISQSELADVLGTTPNYLNKKINGTGPDFRLSEVRKINTSLGIPINIFFNLKVPIKER